MNSKLKNTLINIGLFLVILVFVWPFEKPFPNKPFPGLLIRSIKAPINFKTEKEIREAEVINRLIDIREAEILYKQTYRKYTSNFDSLISFCNNYQIPIVERTVDPTDLEYMEAHNGEAKIITDTVAFISVRDSLFKGRDDLNFNDLRFIPFSEPPTEFTIEDNVIDQGGIQVPVFVVEAPYEVYLKTPGVKFTENQWETRVSNLKAEMEHLEKYPGLKIGSLKEASTDGNWETIGKDK